VIPDTQEDVMTSFAETRNLSPFPSPSGVERASVRSTIALVVALACAALQVTTLLHAVPGGQEAEVAATETFPGLFVP
jgi:hypothetical protein